MKAFSFFSVLAICASSCLSAQSRPVPAPLVITYTKQWQSFRFSFLS
jgi:hypothetical protein